MTDKKPVVEVIRTEAAQDLPLPHYATPDSAGLDLRAAVPADAPMTLEPATWALVPTGLKLAIPRGYEGQVRPRSGLALRYGIGMVNGPGTIDADYRGEVGVLLYNFGKEPFVINRGDRIAQLVIARVDQLAWVEVEELVTTQRGDGGFGHTGHQ